MHGSSLYACCWRKWNWSATWSGWVHVCKLQSVWCVCVCVCVCVWFVQACIPLYLHAFVCMYIMCGAFCLCVCVCVCTYVCMYVCVCSHARAYRRMGERRKESVKADSGYFDDVSETFRHVSKHSRDAQKPDNEMQWFSLLGPTTGAVKADRWLHGDVRARRPDGMEPGSGGDQVFHWGIQYKIALICFCIVSATSLYLSELLHCFSPSRCLHSAPYTQIFRFGTEECMQDWKEWWGVGLAIWVGWGGGVHKVLTNFGIMNSWYKIAMHHSCVAHLR